VTSIQRRRTLRLASRIEFWLAAVNTLVGVVYFVVMIGVAVSGHLTLPPPQAVQEFASMIALLQVVLLPALMACIYHTTRDEKKILRELALIFTVLFAAMASINRYVQLTIVRQGVLTGNTGACSASWAMTPARRCWHRSCWVRGCSWARRHWPWRPCSTAAGWALPSRRRARLHRRKSATYLGCSVA
jgi:hypothetical protein